jgi:hypothetical protein
MLIRVFNDRIRQRRTQLTDVPFEIVRSNRVVSGRRLARAVTALIGRADRLRGSAEICFPVASLQPGTAGLFLLIRKMTTDKVLADLK